MMKTQGRKLEGAELLKTPLHGIYIPTLLCLFGVTILNYDYLPYMILILVLFFGFHFIRVKFQRPVLNNKEFQPYELIDKTIISKNSAIYRFKLDKDYDSLNVPIGHHLICRVNINGEDLIRYYTPISNKFDQGFFDILVKSYKDGKVSKYFGHLRIGQKVDFKGPTGKLKYNSKFAKEIYMIAGGTGITPMLSVLGSVITTPEDLTKVTIIFANETENDILLKDELDEYIKEYPNFKIFYVLNKPTNKNWDGFNGLITKEILQDLLPEPDSNKKILISGPMGMRKSVLEITEELGWPKGKTSSEPEDQVFCF